MGWNFFRVLDIKSLFFVLAAFLFSLALVNFSMAQMPPSGGGGSGGGGGCWDFTGNETCLNQSDNYDCMWKDSGGFGDSWGWCEKSMHMNCWQYGDSPSCTNGNCTWEGYGYCYMENCWDFNDKSSCQQASVTTNGSINCKWETMGTADTTDDYCYEQGCWNYNDNTSCTDASCTWGSQGGGWCSDMGCWNYVTENNCNAQGNCEWEGGSNCRFRGCGDYSDNTSCLNLSAHPYMNCKWDNSNKYCYDIGCWNFGDNATYCNTTSANYNLTCVWDVTGNYCYSPSCWDLGTQGTCESQADDLNCYWDSTWSECHEQGCWSFSNETTCEGSTTPSCNWRSEGWCNMYDCWAFKNESSCGTASLLGMECSWENQTHCEGPGEYHCWDYDNNQTACDSITGCEWKTGWCNKPGCWSYDDNQTLCEDQTDSYDCFWKQDQYGSFCEMLGCWSLNDNASFCVNNTYNLTCNWDNQSMNCYEKGCWDYQSSDECTNTTLHPKQNCSWDAGGNYCYEEGCWNYHDNTTCLSNNCMWESGSGSGYCEQDMTGQSSVDCWSLSTSSSCSLQTECIWEEWGNCNDKNNCWSQSTKTDCEALATAKRCAWNTEYAYCYEKGCWEYSDSGNCTAAGCGWDGNCYEEGCWKYPSSGECLNLTDSLECKWENHEYCYQEGCWDYGSDETNCTNMTLHPTFNCTWQTSGWCENENSSGVDCWQYWDKTNCDGAHGCWWMENSYCEEPGPWQYQIESSCTTAGFSWKSEGGWCKDPTEIQCWNFNQTVCEGAYNTTCNWDGYNCMEKGCWEYYDNSSCDGAPATLGCEWIEQGSSSGWCEQLDCWTFMNQTACNAHASDMECRYATFGWCEQKNCWMQETNATCLNASDSLDCMWEEPGSCGKTFSPCALCFGWNMDNPDCSADLDIPTCNVTHAPWCWWNDTSVACEANQTACNQTLSDSCSVCESNYNSGDCTYPCEWHGSGWCENDFGRWDVDCGQYGDNSTMCNQTDGCSWKTGHCNEKGCQSYNDLDDCENSTLHQNFNCSWHQDQYGSWCEEMGCWNYWNQSSCNDHNVTNDPAMGCTWNVDMWNPSNGWCEEPGCWSKHDNVSCNNFVYKGKNCTWYSDPSGYGGWCEMGGCMSYDDNETACNTDSECMWRADSHCERARCWMWDSMNGGNQTLCENNTYNLSCTWDNSSGPGLCMEAYAGCDAFNNDKDGCFGIGFCWWDEGTQECKSPGDMSGGDVWMEELEGERIDPECWVFDYAQMYCDSSYVDVCKWYNSTSECKGLSSGAVIKCGNIKNSELCEEIAILSSCCQWKNNKCTAAPESTSCYMNMEEPPAGAMFCEDYAAYTDETTCKQIAGSPWFMPCEWDGTYCVFRAEDKFGGTKKGCDSITNKKDCEFSGCDWNTDFYCDNTTAVPFGWCEKKTGTESKRCDAACWACEWKDSKGNTVNASNAQSACQGSAIGYCQFTADTTAPNGIGFCDVPDDVQYIGDCSTDCKSCEKKNDPQSECESSNANCKWVSDTTGATTIGGWCYPKSEKSCAEDCFRCYEQKDCVNYGGGSKGKCSWDSTTGICQPKNFNKEICFDGVDNDGDSRIDCEDSDCFSDAFCGAGMLSDCWKYNNQNDCNSLGNTSNCIWIKDPWENKEWCGMQGENCFMWDGDQSGCDNQQMCNWFNDPMGGFCEVKDSIAKDCFKATTQGACSIKADCFWKIDSTSSTGGNCKPKIFNCETKSTQVTCTSGEYSSRCTWEVDSETGTGKCAPICFSQGLQTSTACGSNTNCNWMSGFCDPADQFGMKMEDCWKYDDNVTACQQAAGCDYHTPKDGGFCDINKTMNDQGCMFYGNNNSGCTADPNCKWNGDPVNGWCDLKIFACGWYSQNQTSCEVDANVSEGLECAWVDDGFCECMDWANGCQVDCFGITNESGCNAQNANGCGWKGPRCEPICFNYTDPGSCSSGAPLCSWRGGFCEPKMAKIMFGGMEEKPIDIGGDSSGCGAGSPDENLDDELDICGFGIREMQDNYGFGTGVDSLENALLCKGKKIVKSGQMGMQEISDSGKGSNVTKFYLYLDTDGSETGGCWLWNDPTKEGYEFFFKYEVKLEDGEIKEKRSSYKCKNQDWVISDIKISSWGTLMCSEIGGYMLAVNKDDLKKFSDLFTPGEKMRVYVASAGKKRTESNPADTAGPGYYVPGTMDFKFEDCMTPRVDMDGDGLFSENDPDCSDFFKDGGFIKHEDCFETGNDEDNDGLVDCADPDCGPAPNCAGKGVNVQGYTDTSAPKVVWTEVDKFPDAAFIKYDTDEPANGTVQFYGDNDTSCATLNATIKDPALLDEKTTNDYKNWHDGPLDDFAFNPQKLNYSLLNGTAYYYKIKVCDSSGNCALSACQNFTTAASSSKADCPKCYSMIPGEGSACGASKQKIGYNEVTDIPLATGGNTVITIENVKGSSFNSPNVSSGGTTTSGGSGVGYTGMDSDEFDAMRSKIGAYTDVNCTITIPKGTSGDCSKLWHCPDPNGSAIDMSLCDDRSNDGVLLNNTATSCIWQVPCEFSVWVTNPPSSGTPPGGTTGPTGSPGGAPASVSGDCTEDWSCTEWDECLDGIQKRTCTDLNECGTITSMPSETQSCSAEGGTEDGITEDTCTDGQRRCSANQVQTCSNGEWTVTEICNNGCNDLTNACNVVPPITLDITLIIGVVAVVIIAVLSLGIYKKRIGPPKRHLK